MSRYIILGHDNPDIDSVFSGIVLEDILRHQGMDASFLIPDLKLDESVLEVASGFGVDVSKYFGEIPIEEDIEFILVDHHSRVLPKNPKMIFDHHPNSYFERNNPFYYNYECSSTACLIGQVFEKELTKEEMKSILFSTMVSTISFHSNKTVPEDISWLSMNAKRFGLDMNDYVEDGLAVCDIKDAKDFAFRGLKHYDFYGEEVESSYLQLKNVSENKNNIQQILSILQEYTRNKNLYEFGFFVHDMDHFSSLAFYIYPDTIDNEKFDRIVARSKVFVPRIKEELQNRMIQKAKKKN